jgi:hypothetical protein
MYEPAGCSTRSKALVALAMYGATVVLTVLLFTDPGLGAGGASEEMYFPPLFFPAVLLGLFTSAVTLGLGVARCVTSFKMRRGGWASAFVVLTLLCVLGPVVLFISVNWHPATSVGSPKWNFIAFLLASGPLLTLVATLFSPARLALDES